MLVSSLRSPIRVSDSASWRESGLGVLGAVDCYYGSFCCCCVIHLKLVRLKVVLNLVRFMFLGEGLVHGYGIRVDMGC